MAKCSICSNNPIKERKLKLTQICSRTVKSAKINGHKECKINGHENDETTFCSKSHNTNDNTVYVHWYKNLPCPKGHGLMDLNRLLLKQRTNYCMSDFTSWKT